MVSSLQTQFQQIMTYHFDIPTKNCLVLDVLTSVQEGLLERELAHMVVWSLTETYKIA